MFARYEKFEPMVDSEKGKAILSWMNNGAPPHQNGRGIVDDMCNKLVAAGIALDRFALFIFTIHPTIGGQRISWSPQKGASLITANYGLFNTDMYQDNPIPTVLTTKQSVRRRLLDNDCPNDYIIVDELREEGFSDYMITPLVFISGEVHCASWSSRAPDGFSDEAIALIHALCQPLARLTEIYMLRLNSGFLLSTYVGRNAGSKVLAGQVKLGDGEDIQAVILFADLKNFTSRSNQQKNSDTLAMLNRFFGALEKPIRENNGEILKFMGDGLLAIFPFSAEKSGRENAVNAAYDALKSAEKELSETGDKTCEFRAAIHLGKLHYGNIGGEQRLDFTAIGPAVNLTARLLSNAKNIGSDFVCSAEVATVLPAHVGDTQSFSAKGFSQPQQIFALNSSHSR